MVFFFTAKNGYVVYMGKDKFENEELIKYGLPEDIWYESFLQQDSIFILFFYYYFMDALFSLGCTHGPPLLLIVTEPFKVSRG